MGGPESSGPRESEPLASWATEKPDRPEEQGSAGTQREGTVPGSVFKHRQESAKCRRERFEEGVIRTEG